MDLVGALNVVSEKQVSYCGPNQTESELQIPIYSAKTLRFGGRFPNLILIIIINLYNG